MKGSGFRVQGSGSERRGKAPLAMVAAAAGGGVAVLAAAVAIVFLSRPGAESSPAVTPQMEESGVPPSECLQPVEPAAVEGASPERVRAAVDAAVAANAALLDDPALVALMNSCGEAAGDLRQSGPLPPDGDRAVRRWELHFLRGSTLDNYARQIDHFGIELGVLLPGGTLAYASGFTQPKPQSRSGPADAERRYYLTWCDSEAQQADRELLARAGLPSEGLVILKFLPPALEARLAELEQKHAADQLGAILKTSFAVRAEGDGYAWHVIEQARK